MFDFRIPTGLFLFLLLALLHSIERLHKCVSQTAHRSRRTSFFNNAKKTRAGENPYLEISEDFPPRDIYLLMGVLENSEPLFLIIIAC